LNILFILYGGLTANSLNHAVGFAEELIRRGHACALALKLSPGETANGMAMPVWSHSETVGHAHAFPDGRPADIIHLWTPRPPCLDCLLDYQRTTAFSARVLVHLEDNERFLLAHTAGAPFEEVARWRERRLRPLIRKGLSHPVRHQLLLAAADAVTVITPKLGEWVPPGVPIETLPPGIDLQAFQPQAPDTGRRDELGLPPHERIIVYPGGANLTNAGELRTLYAAVVLLNQRGVPVKLVRTGPPTPWFMRSLSDAERAVALELGFVERTRIPGLLNLADVLVQPGRAGPFNDYRLPSKIPEFLASGRPVVLPATNIALQMQDGRDALFLRKGTPDEIAACCERILSDPDLAATLGSAGRRFAETHFDLVENTDRLEALYRQTLQQPAAADWSRLRTRLHDEADLFPLASGGASPPDILMLAARRRRHWLRSVVRWFLPTLRQRS
jgi:glycosyltransferase involved in cell wall biosynthesis